MPRSSVSAASRSRTPPPQRDRPEFVELLESCNASLLRRVACTHLAGQWRPNGCATLRTTLLDWAAKGSLHKTKWHEEDLAVANNVKGRRYSGDEKKEGRALFSLPGYIRDLGRVGQPLVVIDMINAYPTIIHRRHPELTALARYVTDREAILSSIPAPRVVAKNLFVRLVFGGTVHEWRKDHGVWDDLPDFVSDFQADMAQALQAAKAKFSHLEPGKAMHLVNTMEEREVMEKAQTHIESLGGRVVSFEHDGLAVSFAQAPSMETLREGLEVATRYPMTVKSTPDLDGALEYVERISGLKGWTADDEDEAILEYEALRRRCRTEPAFHHGVFAELLIKTPMVSERAPWPLRELFARTTGGGHYHFDLERLVWVPCDERAFNVMLGGVAETMLLELLRTYEYVDDKFQALPVRGDVTNKAFRDGVVSSLLKHLMTSRFDLDESTRYLNFEGRVWDRDAEHFVDARPDMKISRSAGWRPSEDARDDELDAILACVRREQDERGLDKPALLSDDLKERLERAQNKVLGFLFDATKEWETVVHCLMHFARGLFGVRFAEALFLHSSGRSGKDTVANLLQALAGEYAVTVACDALCAVPQGDAPSPTVASMRARRFVFIREATTGSEKRHVLRADLFKRVVDPYSELSGRHLHKEPISFAPQHLTIFCANRPVEFDVIDEAVRARRANVYFSAVFVDAPTEANHSRRKDLNMEVLKRDYRDDAWEALRLVDKHLLKGRCERNVRPIPAMSLEAAQEAMVEEDKPAWRALLAKLEPVGAPAGATLAAEIEKAVCEDLGMRMEEAKLFLQGKGFCRERRRRGLDNVYLYKYAFEEKREEEPARKGPPSWVRLPKA
jgi:hypothetical protein